MNEKKGGPILRHEKTAPARGNVAHADDARITAHIEAALGAGGMVWHEIVSDRIHVDVHTAPPTATRPFHVLVTAGMSALPMHVPQSMERRDEWLYAELCVLLPAAWKLDQEAFSDARWYWPIRLLKTLARLPHEYESWLGWGHSIPNGDPAAPYAPGTALAGAVLIPPYALGAPFFSVPGAPPLHVFQLLPVTRPEMDFKLERGIDALLEKLEEKLGEGVFGPIDPARPSAV